MTKWNSHAQNVERIHRPNGSHDSLRLHSAERVDMFTDDLWDAFVETLCEEDIRYYPDSGKLATRIAARSQLCREHIFLSDGSDRVIRTIFETFVTPDSRVIIADPTFPMYNVYGLLKQAEMVKIPYHNGSIDMAMIMNAIDDRTNLVIIPNPSSPIGDAINCQAIDDLCRVAADYDCMVAIDEAYVEFSKYQSIANLVRGPHTGPHDNLIVIRTFSKAWGSAGMRCGYALSQFSNINKMNKFAPMNDITGLTIRWIDLLLDKSAEVYHHVEKVKSNMSELCDWYGAYHEVMNTDCNWIWVSTKNYNLNNIHKNCMIRKMDNLPGKPRKETWIQLCVPADLRALKAMVPQR